MSKITENLLDVGEFIKNCDEPTMFAKLGFSRKIDKDEKHQRLQFKADDVSGIEKMLIKNTFYILLRSHPKNWRLKVCGFILYIPNSPILNWRFKRT